MGFFWGVDRDQIADTKKKLFFGAFAFPKENGG
jgi:hypothetical protein